MQSEPENMKKTVSKQLMTLIQHERIT